ncbi:MAG: RtcB family protein [Bacteroidales bacterium]|nr:RtcB family protein [Bacteroidales bacterium]MCF8399630.1 RtcB family protein [Bacteroidales bacterium]
MKKLKLKGRELKRLGFDDDRAISLALRIVKHKIKRGDRLEILTLLQDMLYQPSKYEKDINWGELAKMMMEVKPTPRQKYSTDPRPKPESFKIYGPENIDPLAIEQMQMAMKMPLSIKGALMPDGHVGYGLPIGGVVATYNAVMPYGVGMDIGCRMCMSVYPIKPGLIDQRRESLKDLLIENTRFGHAEFKDIGSHELMERKEFSEIKFLKDLQKTFYKQLGTSGHGNHFVDIGYLEVSERSAELDLEPGAYFSILSHSGSRNFGAQIARHYTRIAKEKLNLEGEAAKLAWLDLDSEEGQEYWLAMNLAGDYAKANNHIIHDKLSEALAEKPLIRIENHHNFAWKEKLSKKESIIVHRKGATPAHPGTTGIIPGSMISPAFVVSGKGSEESINSAAHGAGRLISRRQAKKNLDRSRLIKLLKNAGVELIGGGLDESPEVYKDIFEVMEAQRELVNVLATFYPKIVRME